MYTRVHTSHMTYVPQNVVDLNTQEEYMYRIRVYRYLGTGIKDLYSIYKILDRVQYGYPYL